MLGSGIFRKSGTAEKQLGQKISDHTKKEKISPNPRQKHPKSHKLHTATTDISIKPGTGEAGINTQGEG